MKKRKKDSSSKKKRVLWELRDTFLESVLIYLGIAILLYPTSIFLNIPPSELIAYVHDEIWILFQTPPELPLATRIGVPFILLGVLITAFLSVSSIIHEDKFESDWTRFMHLGSILLLLLATLWSKNLELLAVELTP